MALGGRIKQIRHPSEVWDDDEWDSNRGRSLVAVYLEKDSATVATTNFGQPSS